MPSTKEIHQEPLFGQLVFPNIPGSALPLTKTSVSAQITGLISLVSVKQFFTNPIPEPLELEYIFPLPHKASLVGFDIKIGNRTLCGDLQEIKAAQQAYWNARQAGQQTGLLEQRRPNLFAVQIANIRPGEEVHAEIRYQENLAFDNGEFEFVFPMGITPKYHSSENPEEQEGVDAPIAMRDEPIGPVEISVSVDAGVAVKDPTSPSHLLSVTRLDERRFTLTLGANAIPDHDFVFRYQLAAPQTSIAAWLSPEKNGDYFLASIIPPALEGDLPPLLPREFVFVFDRSGSMSGEPIAQARNALQACLRILNPEDTFYILFFDDRIEWFRPTSSPVTQSFIDQADQYLATIAGRGGTEIIKALDQAITLPRDPQERTRYIIFLTDGAVSADSRMLDHLRRKLSNERIFTFGIGPAVNRALLSELARAGRGLAEYLQLDEDIEGAIMRFQDRISYPLLTNISITFENCKAWDIFPSQIPDLYVGQPIELSGRLKAKSGKTPSLLIKAQRQGVDISQRADFLTSASDPVIQRAWVRAQLDELLEQFSSQPHDKNLRNKIIQLALEHQIVSPFTAFVAIDSEVILKPGEKAAFIKVAQPLPQGLDIDGFVGGAVPVARMAMAAPPPPGVDMMLKYAPAPMATVQRIPSGHMKVKEGSITSDEALPASRINRPFETLRLLARSQNLNGSWNDDLETSAVALLAFVRQGNSPLKGGYRRQLGKVYEWLLAQKPAAGFGAFIRALAFHELAQLIKDAKYVNTARQCLVDLPAPATDSEKTVLQVIKNPASIGNKMKVSNLDDLRLAGLLRAIPEEPLDLPDEIPPLLVQAWLACI